MLRGLRQRLASRIEPNPIDDENPATLITARGAVGTIADALSLLTVVGSGVTLLVGGSVAQAVLALALTAIAGSFVVVTFHLQRVIRQMRKKYARRSRFAEANEQMAECQRALTSATVAIVQNDESAFGAQMASAAGALSRAFSTVAGTTVRVAIKGLAIADGREDVQAAEVSTLTRFPEPIHGTREAGLPISVPVVDNSDYHAIMGGDSHFFSDDLSAETLYRNSHIPPGGSTANLPYQATIVWPIYGRSHDMANPNTQVIGFLCIDSARAGTFTESTDVPAGQVIASAMYGPLSLFDQRRRRLDAEEAPAGPSA